MLQHICNKFMFYQIYEKLFIFWVKLNEKRVKTSNISKVIKKLKFEEKFSIVATKPRFSNV